MSPSSYITFEGFYVVFQSILHDKILIHFSYCCTHLCTFLVRVAPQEPEPYTAGIFKNLPTLPLDPPLPPPSSPPLFSLDPPSLSPPTPSFAVGVPDCSHWMAGLNGNHLYTLFIHILHLEVVDPLGGKCILPFWNSFFF